MKPLGVAWRLAVALGLGVAGGWLLWLAVALVYENVMRLRPGYYRYMHYADATIWVGFVVISGLLLWRFFRR